MKDEVLIPKKARLVGGSGEGKKKIFISKDVYREIFSFSKDKNVCEAGGILLGEVIIDGEISYTIIQAFIEAQHSEGTSNSITFTKDTWNYIEKEREKYPDYDVVGWMHTNPDTGCKATEYDVFFHSHVFEDENVVAYIVDPVQIVEAFYFLVDGEMVPCNGFYIFSDNAFNKQKKESESEKDAFIVDDTEENIKSDNGEDAETSESKEKETLKGEEEQIRNLFEKVESDVEADKSDVEAEHRISDNVDFAEIRIHEDTSVKFKVWVSILGVLVAAMAIAMGIMAMRIVQLEKDINSLYRNDEVIAKYINGEETASSENTVPEQVTEASEEPTNAAETEAAEEETSTQE